ncbi:MAG: TraR/DksA family transcriptional regulator [Gammaproteobacteria bacterium]|nr:TraR/DksA family transcriptional regulator [Gammaproteobacteria bacterium]
MPLSKQQLEALRQAIESRRAALARELHDDAARMREETFGALAGPVTDTADEAVADLLSDLDNAELSRDLAELRALENAQARLVEDGFGICVDCGTEIPYARLSVQPATLRCIDCQRLHEKTFAHLDKPKL